MVKVSSLSDTALRALANGEAEAELHRRQQRRREREKAMEEARAEQAKQEYVQALCGDCVSAWAEDPRTGPRQETAVYDKITGCCGWVPDGTGMSIDEAVNMSRHERKRRKRGRGRRMHQIQRFGPTVTVPGVGEIPAAGIGIGVLVLLLIVGR